MRAGRPEEQRADEREKRDGPVRKHAREIEREQRPPQHAERRGDDHDGLRAVNVHDPPCGKCQVGGEKSDEDNRCDAVLREPEDALHAVGQNADRVGRADAAAPENAARDRKQAAELKPLPKLRRDVHDANTRSCGRRLLRLLMQQRGLREVCIATAAVVARGAHRAVGKSRAARSRRSVLMRKQ